MTSCLARDRDVVQRMAMRQPIAVKLCRTARTVSTSATNGMKIVANEENLGDGTTVSPREPC